MYEVLSEINNLIKNLYSLKYYRNEPLHRNRLRSYNKRFPPNCFSFDILS